MAIEPIIVGAEAESGTTDHGCDRQDRQSKRDQSTLDEQLQVIVVSFDVAQIPDSGLEHQHHGTEAIQAAAEHWKLPERCQRGPPDVPSQRRRLRGPNEAFERRVWARPLQHEPERQGRDNGQPNHRSRRSEAARCKEHPAGDDDEAADARARAGHEQRQRHENGRDEVHQRQSTVGVGAPHEPGARAFAPQRGQRPHKPARRQPKSQWRAHEHPAREVIPVDERAKRSREQRFGTPEAVDAHAIEYVVAQQRLLADTKYGDQAADKHHAAGETPRGSARQRATQTNKQEKWCSEESEGAQRQQRRHRDRVPDSDWRIRVGIQSERVRKIVATKKGHRTWAHQREPAAGKRQQLDRADHADTSDWEHDPPSVLDGAPPSRKTEETDTRAQDRKRHVGPPIDGPECQRSPRHSHESAREHEARLG